MFPRLQSARLVLRAFQERDLPTLVAYRSDPDIARYQSWDPPYSHSQAEAMLTRMQQHPPGTPGKWFQVAIELKTSGTLIGDCAFCILDQDPPAQAEIGYTLASAYQHHGYATEAASRLIEHLFLHYELHRIRANCDAENLRSARLLTRLGMRHEGCFVENVWEKGRWASELHFAILAREWRDQRCGI